MSTCQLCKRKSAINVGVHLQQHRRPESTIFKNTLQHLSTDALHRGVRQKGERRITELQSSPEVPRARPRVRIDRAAFRADENRAGGPPGSALVHKEGAPPARYVVQWTLMR